MVHLKMDETVDFMSCIFTTIKKMGGTTGGKVWIEVVQRTNSNLSMSFDND